MHWLNLKRSIIHFNKSGSNKQKSCNGPCLALNKANIPWRVLYSTSSLLGIHAAIEAGLGISALAINTAPSTLTNNGAHQRLPELGKVTIGFHYDHAGIGPAAARLLDYLRRGLQRTRGEALLFDSFTAKPKT